MCSISIYNALINACGKSNQLQRALELRFALQHRGLLPDVITYSALTSACEKGTLLQRAVQLFETMLHQGLLPEVITYSALISACEKGRTNAKRDCEKGPLRKGACEKGTLRKEALRKEDTWRCVRQGTWDKGTRKGSATGRVAPLSISGFPG